MSPRQQVFRIRRNYNQWVANETLEDYALRFTAKRARRWSLARVANTALGAISFLALEAIGGAITINYGFSNAIAAIVVVCSLIFLTSVPISYYAAKYGIDIDLLTRGAGFGYIGSTITSLIYASFTFIFFALEAAILSSALEALFDIPLSIGYLISSLLVIPLVTHGITLISRFQLWTQPLWVVLQLLPFVCILVTDTGAVRQWTQYQGEVPGASTLNLLLFGAASSVIFSLVAQIGEQVDFLRFLPEPRPHQRRRWWAALIAAGPGWIIIGALKIIAGSFLALLALRHGIGSDDASDPMHMYTVAFGYLAPTPQTALALAGIFVIVSQVKINVTNAYAGSIAWSNFFSRLTHSHPGRVVWLVFNVAIALLLMELGIYHVLEQILGTYAIVAVAWVGTLVADLVINKPLGLSPPHIEFKRAHLYDVNPVGVGAMVGASIVGVAARLHLFGETLYALAPFVTLLLTFILAPAIALLTGGRFYIARQPALIAADVTAASPVEAAPGAERRVLTCCICEHRFEREDMAFCPSYAGPICSLCCSLDSRCNDACKTQSRVSEQIVSALAMLLPPRLINLLASRLGHFIGLFLSINTVSALLLLLIHEHLPSNEALLVASTLWKVFFTLMIITGVIAWLFVLAHDSRRVAQEESQRQTRLLIEEIAAHEETDRELQKAKEIAEAANQAKSRYLTGISHELRTPLNAVLGYAQLLEHDESIPASRRDSIAVIRRSGEHLADLIEGLLDISKIEAGRLDLHRDEVRIRTMLDQLVYMFRLQAAASGIEFEFVRETAIPECVATDEKRLRQILINLLSNAIKYTERGKVTLKVKYRNQVAEFSVSDTGVGIAAEDMERIFRPFERVRKPGVPAVSGTGLGLTITKLLTEIMGGDLRVTSEPGNGSTFTVTMMLASIHKPSALPATERTITGYVGARKTVLVVDDDASHRGLVSDILMPLGFIVMEAQDCLAAREIIAHCRPDIFLLDMEMPGETGAELAAWLRSNGYAEPIIVISADAREGSNDDSAPAPYDDYIIKPLRVTPLLEKLGAALKIVWSNAESPVASIEPASPLQVLTEEDFPSDACTRELLYLAHIGNANGIKARLKEIEQQGQASSRFIALVLAMTSEFRFDKLIETLGGTQPEAARQSGTGPL
jgi:signal transduction histidine kinase/FixJ family two-component response regulator